MMSPNFHRLALTAAILLLSACGCLWFDEPPIPLDGESDEREDRTDWLDGRWDDLDSPDRQDEPGADDPVSDIPCTSSEACIDDDPCTEEYCDPLYRVCVFPLRDADGDGYGDSACGGPDCDDGDEDVSPEAEESCTDGIDNDCDGRADCNDTQCFGTAQCPCASFEANCGDGGDGDCDGASDCGDPDCSASCACTPSCAESEDCCYNGCCDPTSNTLCCGGCGIACPTDSNGCLEGRCVECTTSSQCDDGNECTVDQCNSDNTCTVTTAPDMTSCIWGVCCGGSCLFGNCCTSSDCSPGCLGYATDCSVITDPAQCATQSGCSAETGYCSGYATGCAGLTDQASCTACGCNWHTSSSNCTGSSPSCYVYGDSASCATCGCSWILCNGYHPPCETYVDAQTCSTQLECHWSDYPTCTDYNCS